MVKMEINDYITEFTEILGHLTLRLKGTEGKVGVATAIIQEINKDRRVAEMKKERETSNNPVATEDQKSYMRDLGLEVTEGLTKAEASKILYKALAQRKNESSQIPAIKTK
ncbi:hypothetical protein AUJ66_08780 [Candidatus Desantisbacteria bacterium CG1_02_38_46]|uniref:Uncharacterized protein n=2 Tax=unclassified Candidatus Desantisiibacteriota TaxID=3106372 RepID=A0A1J4SAH0_9BACT|nr:MAG: hypothetical protein AUJ66_08780 [Candidatus Desantisbacteria bacterium CG1_02_38_46]